VLETHGTADETVPFNGGMVTGPAGGGVVVAAPAMAARWRELDACRDEPRQDVLPGTEVHRFSADQCAAGTAVVFMQVDGGVHAWPQAFDEAETSWEFFAGHAR
jgi:polyhydroxybutyrate depolymerase